MIDGENMTIEAQTFDAVISRIGLIYFPDQQKALKEMLRVLKKGGKVTAIYPGMTFIFNASRGPRHN